jgi:hypothetical protein
VSLLSGPYVAAAALLIVSGAAKARRPASTVAALRGLRLPGSAFLVRLLAGAELIIGSAALFCGDRWSSALMATSYLAFASFVLFAMTRGEALGSCGCFGQPDTPPSALHVLLTAGASAVGLGAAFRPPGPLVDDIVSSPARGLAFVVLTGCCVWFAYLVLTLLPRLGGLTVDRDSR